jgi:predicted ester cyclase
MSQADNVKVLALFDEIVTARAFDRFGEVFADHVVDHDAADGQGPGLSGVVTFWRGFTRSFPDVAMEVDLIRADDDHVAVAYRFSGTDLGGFMGNEPSGRQFTVRAMEIARFADGRVAERWGTTDTLSILDQLNLR